MNHKFFLIFSITFLSLFSYSQDEESNSQIDILRPSKAAFYSAVLPGLGKYITRKRGRYRLFMQQLVFLDIHMILIKKSFGRTEMPTREERQVILMTNIRV